MGGQTRAGGVSESLKRLAVRAGGAGDQRTRSEPPWAAEAAACVCVCIYRAAASLGDAWSCTGDKRSLIQACAWGMEGDWWWGHSTNSWALSLHAYCHQELGSSQRSRWLWLIELFISTFPRTCNNHFLIFSDMMCRSWLIAVQCYQSVACWAWRKSSWAEDVQEFRFRCFRQFLLESPVSRKKWWAAQS